MVTAFDYENKFCSWSKNKTKNQITLQSLILDDDIKHILWKLSFPIPTGLFIYLYIFWYS